MILISPTLCILEIEDYAQHLHDIGVIEIDLDDDLTFETLDEGVADGECEDIDAKDRDPAYSYFCQHGPYTFYGKNHKKIQIGE